MYIIFTYKHKIYIILYYIILYFTPPNERCVIEFESHFKNYKPVSFGD